MTDFPRQATKRPVTIDYWRWNGEEDTAGALVEWIEENGGSAWLGSSDEGPAVVIETLEGEMAGGPGWVFIRGVAGEFYPCKAEIFDATYDTPVGDEEVWGTRHGSVRHFQRVLTPNPNLPAGPPAGIARATYRFALLLLASCGDGRPGAVGGAAETAGGEGLRGAAGRTRPGRGRVSTTRRAAEHPRRGSGFASHATVHVETVGEHCRQTRQAESVRTVTVRHAARRGVARQALRRSWSPAETREVLEALGLEVSPRGLAQAIRISQKANSGDGFL